MTTQPELQVRHKPERHMFELETEGHSGRITYQRRGNVIDLQHTVVSPALEGRRIAGKLAAFALDYARAEHLRVIPSCPYVHAYIERHPQYADLVG